MIQSEEEILIKLRTASFEVALESLKAFSVIRYREGYQGALKTIKDNLEKRRNAKKSGEDCGKDGDNIKFSDGN